MRVIVMSDMEGVAGIVKWQQVGGGEAMYAEGRRLYTAEINAAVRGAKAAGAIWRCVVSAASGRSCCLSFLPANSGGCAVRAR